MSTSRGIALVCASLVLCIAASAQAGTHPHDRNGFMIGFSVGGGSAGIDGGDGREGGGTGNFRIGYAVRPDLVLHLESAAWTRTFSEQFGDVTWTISSTTAAMSYHVPNSGAFFRGGIGFGVANVEVEAGGVKVSSDETGLGLIFATGFEWRLTQKFALGPHVDFTYQSQSEVSPGTDRLENHNKIGYSSVIGGGLGFNWYW